MTARISFHPPKDEKITVSAHSYETFCTLNIAIGSDNNGAVFFFPKECLSHMEKVAEVWNNPKVETHDPSP